MGSPRPLAVALLDVAGMSLVEQVAARRRLAEVARTEGYDLLEVLEVGRGRRDDDVYAAAVDLAQRKAAALLVHGDVEHHQLHHAVRDLAVRIVRTGLRRPSPTRPVPARPTGLRTAGTPSARPARGVRPGGRGLLAALEGVR